MKSRATNNQRSADVRRKTKETDVRVKLNLDGSGKSKISIGLPFLEHMLELFAKHGLFDLDVTCVGDLEIDDHHSVEDIAITLGQALTQALADKAGINLHIDCLRGRNTHHILEGTFKASARALRQAVERNSRVSGIPSTKGSL
jgi:imidazoleglycerol phosphate dehydratase HisB